MTDEQTGLIEQAQNRFDAAELAGDTETLENLLTDDFQSIGPKGFVLTKPEWIGRHVHFTYHALDVSEVDVRVYGDAAIVRNIQRNRATYNGNETAIAVRVSQTWVRQGDAWRLAGIQFSPLADG
jgi:ketosteroid isomerase-like protein